MICVDAKYHLFPIAALQGNPLIEALRPAVDIMTFAEKLQYRVTVDDAVTLDDFSREVSIELIDLTYTVPVDSYSLYKTIVKNVLTGYMHRNPVTRDFAHEQYRAATEDNYHFSPQKNLAKVISVIGLSGAGKTLAIRNCLSFFPQLIKHVEYHDKRFVSQQIVYLEFQAPVTKTTRGFVLSFFKAVDELIDTDYYQQWRGKSISVPILIQEAKKVAFNHHVGLVFIDEIQRCASADAKADFATLEFIDDFFNSVGIPLIVAGTYKAMPLFRTTMSTTRRLSSSRSFTMDVIKNDLNNLGTEEPSFWSHFIDAFYYPKLLQHDFVFDVELKKQVHELTLGIPALVTRLMRLAYEEALTSGDEAITIELLQDVYFEQFSLLHPAIESLRKGQYGGYEDLLPESVFKPTKEQQIEKIIQEDIAFSERMVKKKVKDEDSVYIEVDDAEQDFIPSADLRNLKGLSKDELAKTLKGKKK